MTLTDTLINSIDKQGMRNLLRGFYRQVNEGVEISKTFPKLYSHNQFNLIVLSGLGGSAIGGDLVRSYLLDELKIPLIINRTYTLPKYVNQNSLVIISSYSGNTEESIAAYKEAKKRKAKVLCITSGGEVSNLAIKYKDPVILIPGGLPPRAALGYSFFPLLFALAKMGFVVIKKKDVVETISLLQNLSSIYGNLTSEDNDAIQLAAQMKNALPVIYSSCEKFDAVNIRWRSQINENSKMLAYGHTFPELNHNEIVGWEVNAAIMSQSNIFILRDDADHERIQLRMDITQDIVSPFAAGITEVFARGTSLLARIFSLVHLGDWISFYLAMMHKIDPTPVTKIDYLKTELGKIQTKN
ncbi:MAG: bifunctional phosphoglucose/phosphomannose isomerase [Bacteroidetes bacterium]|nr:bifunctional phosphoglucose/phosphomannose isomerase [Bacteroidota bacterium]